MPDQLFISYSALDGRDFALKLADNLAAGPPAVRVWVDKRDIRPGEPWDEQIVEAIRTCTSMIFIMTLDSVRDGSVCKNEWARALKYKKLVIPILRHPEAELPFRLDPREYIDFSGAFDSALARLRTHLAWMSSSDGQLQALKYRLADAERELPRAKPERQARIQTDIEELKREIARQQTIIDNPQAAERRVQQSIDVDVEGERQPANPVSLPSPGKFINPPPVVAPSWFQDRYVETQLVGDFLKDEALRVMTIVGRGGIGKSAMVCRLLRSLQGGKLPDDGGALAVDGIVYLSNTRAFHRVTVPDLYGGLTKLLPEETVKHVEVLYKNPQASTEKRIQALVEAFPRGRTIILLDNFEDALTIDTGQIKDAELNEALHALLKAPPNALKAIITTRVAPSDLPLVEPALQRRVDLDTGLPFPDAKKMLQAMDVDGKVGLQHADDALLAAAWERTRGYPRPLEHLFAVLSADRDTTLKDLLEDTKDFLPEQVVEVLVGEAFSRLDATAQLVMQGLATYRYPVIPTAVDYLLQPHVTGLTSSRVLSRLVNMQFVRRDAGRYYLHQVDLDYALSRIPKGDPGDSKADVPQFTQFALRHRAAEWFKLIRKPRETWKSLEDLSAQLSEFDLRCEAEEYDTAAVLLGEFDFDYLFLWGHYRLMVERHERLQGKIADPFLAKNSVGNLGSAYYRMGRHRQAIVCYEEALRLAQENKDRWNEGVWLGNLGAAVSDIGQTARAIEYLEQALAIRREVGDRGGEALDLANLGFMYDAVGQLSRAVDYYKEALDIDRSVAKKVGVTDDLTNLGSTYIHLGQYDEALESLRESLAIAREIDYRIREADALNEMGHLYLIIGKIEDALRLFEQSIEIADDIGAAKFQNESRTGAATASLYNGDLPAARKMAEAASGYRVLLSDALTATILGVVACRQQDPSAAHKAFTAAIGQVDELLTMTPDLHDVLYTKALALSGLALCGDTKQIPAAREAFAAARKVTSAAGVVRRVLQLFDALAIGDANHILTDVRSVAAGAN